MKLSPPTSANRRACGHGSVAFTPYGRRPFGYLPLWGLTKHQPVWLQTIPWAVVALLAWSFFEHLIHRFALHPPKRVQRIERFACYAHSKHHDEPDQPAYALVPPLNAALILLPLLTLFYFAVPSKWLGIFTGFFLLGYIASNTSTLPSINPSRAVDSSNTFAAITSLITPTVMKETSVSPPRCGISFSEPPCKRTPTQPREGEAPAPHFHLHLDRPADTLRRIHGACS